jgi:hypothetical protein
MLKKAKVIKSHQSDVFIPFQAEKGDIVRGKEKPTEWEGWLYCKNNNDFYGWVPKAFLSPLKDSSEKFEFTRAYDTFEISVLEGESVKIIEIESRWAWVENKRGKIGWVPLDNLNYDEV